MRKLWLLFLMWTLILAAGAVGAQEATEPAPEPTMEVTGEAQSFVQNPLNLVGDEAVAFFMFTHASPDIGPVDLYLTELSDTPILTDVAYGESTGFLFLPAGTYTVAARPTGDDATSEPIAMNNWEFPPNGSWMVVLAGQTADATLQLEPINLLREDLADDVARVRVVNLLADGQEVTVSSADGVADFGSTAGWMGITDVEVAPGSTNLSVAGADGTALVESAPVDLPGGQFTTILLIGAPAQDQPVQMLTSHSPAYRSRVQFVNNTDAPIQILGRPGDTELVPSLAAGETSDWVTVPSGAVTFVTYEPGTGPTGQELGAWIGDVLPFRDTVITYQADGNADDTAPVFTPSMDAEPAAAG